MSDDDRDKPSTGSADSANSADSADSAEDVGISDDQLPEDLQPTDDNPLAKPPSDDDDGEGGLSLGPDGPQQ